MSDLLMGIGRHGTGPALAIFITGIAAAYRWESQLDHPERPAHPSASVPPHNPDSVGFDHKPGGVL